MQKKSILIWLLFIPLAILNGFLRDKWIAPAMGMEYAEPLSGILLCLLMFAVTCLFIPRLGKGTRKQFLRVGLVWMLLTVVFETILGLVAGMSAREILRTYNVLTGNLWLVVVIFVWLTPWLAARTRGMVITENRYRRS